LCLAAFSLRPPHSLPENIAHIAVYRAVDEGSEPAINNVVPWGLENIEYHGLAGDNLLVTKFKDRDGTKRVDQKGK
jgi:hypothetical protein